MYKYKIWARVTANETIHTVIWASSDYDARAIAESQYGSGNVLNYSRIYE
jgi:hypothetical protein